MIVRFAGATTAAVCVLGFIWQTLPTRAETRVEAGILSCQVAGGVGFVFGSTKQLDCIFESGRRRERYYGSISKYGIDIGITKAGLMSWVVLAPTRDFGPGALRGSYGGVTGEATLGVGLGANVLVGGSSRTFALQPLSVQAQQGLNLAVGVAGMELRPE